MEELLLSRPPWFVAGPAIGLVVVAVLAALNERLGVVGGYSEVVENVARRRWSFGWKAWFLLGVVAGGLVFGALSGRSRVGDGYGWLSETFTGEAVVAVPVLLVLAGALIGYGAKTAGGCTSGNGLSGSSFGSPASLVATMTFMPTAVAVALLTSWLAGGR